MVYNLTGVVDNSTTILGFVQGVNNHLTTGWFMTFFLIGLLVIFYSTFIRMGNDVGKSLSATAFIGFVLTLFLTAVDLIQNPIVIFIILLGCSATIAFTWKKN